MTNTIWYIALFATSIAAFVIIILKTPHRRKKTLALWFAVLGFTYCIEVSLVLLFNAYTYHPMITPADPFFDAVFGNIFSQVSVSTSAVLICILGLSNWWLAGFSIVYFLIDVLFVQLGIYEHYWYQSIYTLGGFFIYGLIIKYWHSRLFNRNSEWLYYPTLFLSAFAVSTNLIGTLLKLLDLRVFHSTLYPDPSRTHTATALIYGSVMVLIMIALYRWKSHWWQKAIVFLLLPICQWGLLQSGVMVVKPNWALVVMLFDLAVFYGAAVMMNRCLQSEQRPQLPDV